MLHAALFAFAAFLLPGQEAKEPDYFPLIEGAEYEFLGTFNGKEYTDVNIVKTTTTDSGLTIFYFARKADAAKDNAIVATSSFGLGAYVREKDKLLTCEAFWSRDLAKVTADMKQTLLALPLKEKAEQKFTANRGTQARRTVVAGKEDVTVPAGTFKGCWKIDLEDVWTEKAETSSGTVWLAPDVGMVKWKRATGRIDELVSFKKPGGGVVKAPPEAKGADYFPLVEGTRYEYQGTYQGNKDKSELTVKSTSVGLGSDDRVFYFVTKGDEEKENYIIGANAFGLGAYSKSKGKLLTHEAFWYADLETVKLDSNQTLIEFPLTEKASQKLQASSGKQKITMTVAGKEDVTVPAGTYKACWKIEIKDTWPATGTTYDGAVWLAADVGVVKWLRGTGRVDELLSMKKPK